MYYNNLSTHIYAETNPDITRHFTSMLLKGVANVCHLKFVCSMLVSICYWPRYIVYMFICIYLYTKFHISMTSQWIMHIYTVEYRYSAANYITRSIWVQNTRRYPPLTPFPHCLEPQYQAPKNSQILSIFGPNDLEDESQCQLYVIGV